MPNGLRLLGLQSVCLTVASGSWLWRERERGGGAARRCAALRGAARPMRRCVYEQQQGKTRRFSSAGICAARAK
jgi:hypothetical protein